MAGNEPRISGVGSNYSTNRPTTTALLEALLSFNILDWPIYELITHVLDKSRLIFCQILHKSSKNCQRLVFAKVVKFHQIWSHWTMELQPQYWLTFLTL